MVIDAFPYNAIMRDGDNGIVINKKDDMIDKIRFFLENKSELKRMGNNAYKSIIENFSINEQNVEIIDNIYSVDYESENAE
jgi:spore maturation protein CgeB